MRLATKIAIITGAAQGIGLASDEASHVNGAVLEVSGGMIV
jgi:NAD(P)-dependent dehydrogenase (short-subunit alcohol dehydrogenase family)